MPFGSSRVAADYLVKSSQQIRFQMAWAGKSAHHSGRQSTWLTLVITFRGGCGPAAEESAPNNSLALHSAAASVWPPSCEARALLWTGNLAAAMSAANTDHLPPASAHHVSVDWQPHWKVAPCVPPVGCMLTVKLKRWSAVGQRLETSYWSFLFSADKSLSLSLSGGYDSWAGLSARRRKHVAEVMWSDAEGWGRVCL